MLRVRDRERERDDTFVNDVRLKMYNCPPSYKKINGLVKGCRCDH